MKEQFKKQNLEQELSTHFSYFPPRKIHARGQTPQAEEADPANPPKVGVPARRSSTFKKVSRPLLQCSVASGRGKIQNLSLISFFTDFLCLLPKGDCAEIILRP